MDAAEVIAQAHELIEAGRTQDADSLLVHAVHAGLRPTQLMDRAVARGRSTEARERAAR